MLERTEISVIPFLIMLLSLYMYASVKRRKPKYYRSLISSFTGSQMFEDKSIGNLIKSVSSVFMMTNFFLMSALFFSFYLYGQVEITWWKYIHILIIVLIFATMYTISIRIFTYVFSEKTLGEEFLRVSTYNYEALGIILFLANITLYYLPFEIEKITLVLVFGFFLLKQLKSYSILGKQFSIFHNILYFCTLENLPLLLLIKVVLKSS